jgi:autotransporter-associated beta strand protein
MGTLRIVRKSLLVLPLLLALAVVPTVQAGRVDERTNRPSMEWNGSDDFQSANGAFSTGSRLFYAGPQWLLDALPGSKRAKSRYVVDRAGDPADSYTAYNAYVGTLPDAFDVGLFNNIPSFVGPSAPKTSTVTVAAVGSIYNYNGVINSLWSDDATWGPTVEGYPSVQGDVAVNVLSVSTNVFQDVAGGVTVGTIDHNPTSAANAGPGVTWRITTSNPITMDEDGAGAGSAHISISQTLKINSLTIDGNSGLILADNLIITNANPNGGIINIATPISEVPSGNHSVTVVGPGTTIFSGSNTYQGGTTVSSGTLLVQNSSGSGTGGGAVQVNNGGTLGGGGFINGEAVTVGDGGIITAGTNGAIPANAVTAIGTLTLTVPALNFGSGSFFQVDIGGTTADRLTLLGTGAFNITAGATINFTELSTLMASSYTLATYGSWNGTEFLDPTVPDGYELIYGANSLNLVLVPEPSTWIGGALVLAAIGFTQRRRFTRRFARL